jgi:hypothetical protein
MSRFEYNCVYWWNGGTEHGKWMRSDAGTRDALRNMGYVAHNGSSKIGAPVGPPTLVEIQEVLRPIGLPC